MAIECTTKTKRKNVALREHCREVLSETRLLRECSDARYIYSIRLLQFGWKCDQYMRAHTNRTVGAFAHTQISAHRTFRTDTEWELCVFFRTNIQSLTLLCVWDRGTFKVNVHGVHYSAGHAHNYNDLYQYFGVWKYTDEYRYLNVYPQTGAILLLKPKQQSTIIILKWFSHEIIRFLWIF